MQEKQSIMAVRCRLKIPSLAITPHDAKQLTSFAICASQPFKILIICFTVLYLIFIVIL